MNVGTVVPNFAAVFAVFAPFLRYLEKIQGKVADIRPPPPRCAC